MTGPVSRAQAAAKAFKAGLAPKAPAQAQAYLGQVTSAVAGVPVNRNINTGWSGTGPAPQTAILLARQVIIFGPSGGLFVYNGTPGPDNPPVFSVVAPGTTTDPYGNPVEAVMNAGNISGAHFGLDDSGNAYLADSTGSTRIYLNPGLSELAFYTAGTGALLITVAPATVTDPLTHETVQPGFNMYGQGSSVGKRAQVTLDDNSNPVFRAVTGAADEAVPAEWDAQVFNAGQANQFLYTDFTGPVNTNRADIAYIELQSSTDDLTGSAGGNLVYLSATGTATNILEWGAGGIFANLPQDQNSYDVLTRHLIQTGVQTFSSTSGVLFSMFPSGGLAVAALTYRISGILFCEQVTAAVADDIIIASTATVSSMALRLNYVQYSGLSGGVEINPKVITSTGTVSSPAFSATVSYSVEISGTITFSTAGKLSFEGAASTTSDNWNLNQMSAIDISPVVA